MSGAQRCDEILRLIDEALATCERDTRPVPAAVTPRKPR